MVGKRGHRETRYVGVPPCLSAKWEAPGGWQGRGAVGTGQ